MTTFAERMEEYRWMEREREVWEHLVGEASRLSGTVDPLAPELMDMENPVLQHVIDHIENKIIAPMAEKMGAIEKLEVKDAGKKGTKSEQGSGKEGSKAGGKTIKGKQGLRRPIRLGKKANPDDGGAG